MPSFGTGNQLLGASANQLLGMPGTMAQSPASAGYQQGVLPQTLPNPMGSSTPPSNQLPDAFSAMGGASQPMTPTVPQSPPSFQGGMPQQQGTVGMPPGPSETEMILKALISRLGVHSKHEEAVRNAIIPPQNNIR